MKVRALSAVLALCLPGCGQFFQELESADSAAGEDTDGDEDTDGETDAVALMGDCEFPVDDRCGDQDTIEQCNPDSLTFEVHNCTALCGENVNFSCVTTGTAQHGCYCVEAGPNKIYSCTELESCLTQCGGDPTGACEDQCFGRTTSSTIRLFGALVFCANDDCHETCIERPEFCGSCIADTIATGRGACNLARSVCDADVNDDPNSPWG